MDYLRELQRRQSALLVRLLTMESSREDSDETDATSQRLAAEQPLRQGKRSGREASFSMAPGEKERAAVLPEEEAALKAISEVREPLRAAEEQWEEESGGAAGVSAAAETEPQAAMLYRNRSTDYFWRSPVTPVGVFPEAAETGGGGTDAEALSRTVQRDARRYDGGFTIF